MREKLGGKFLSVADSICTGSSTSYDALTDLILCASTWLALASPNLGLRIDDLRAVQRPLSNGLIITLRPWIFLVISIVRLSLKCASKVKISQLRDDQGLMFYHAI
jgi:hypothetical protein